MRRVLPIALAVLFAAAPAAPAAPPEPWATVNICDTLAHPNEIGVRGDMPGLGRRTRMFMRFRVQYEDGSGNWHTVRDGADSGWRWVATGRRSEHDAGYSFSFKPPVVGGAHILRGVVAFQWRRSGRVVRRDRRITEDGHPGTAGADPFGFSAATCAIA